MFQRIKDIIQMKIRADGADWFFAFIASTLFGGVGLTLLMAFTPGQTPGWPLLTVFVVPLLRGIYEVVIRVIGVQFDDSGHRIQS